ncbi:MAG: GxxExxY protein [Phycisphaerae bacterium]|nr:GxxExxY protein [Phycisphaerae bacterium]
MTTNNTDIVFKDISYKVVGLAMKVHSELGGGFLEKVYENALTFLLEKEGITARQQAPITVYFEGQSVGEYFADILVDGKIILELKTAEKIADAHRTQAIHYLRATGIRLAMILNFGEKSFEYERLVV